MTSCRLAEKDLGVVEWSNVVNWAHVKILRIFGFDDSDTAAEL